MNYREHPALNQSKLKRLLRGPQFYLDAEPETSSSFALGGYLDALISGTDTSEYIVSNVPKPTGQMGQYVQFLYEHKDEYELEHAKDLAYQAVGIKRDSPEKMKFRFETEGLPYYEFLINSEGKTVLTSEEYNLAHDMCNAVINDPYYKGLSSEALLTNFQVPIYQGIQNFSCKGLIDKLVVNKSEIRIIDFKYTGFNINEFDESIKKFGYDFQGAFYSYLVAAEWLYGDYFNEIKGEFIADPFPHLSVYFVVVDKYCNVVVYKLSDKDLDNAYIKIDTALSDLSFYQKNGFSYPKELIKNQFVETKCYEL